MKTDITIHVSQEKVYHQLLESLLFDIRKSGKNITINQIRSGIVYDKKMRTKMGSERNVKVEVKEIIRDSSLVLDFISNTSNTEVHYELTTTEEGTNVIYYEIFNSSSKMNRLNQKVVSIPFSYFAKKKFKKMMQAIENYILSSSTENI